MLFHVVAWFVLLCVVGIGVLFFTIHTLPERMAHRTKKVQLDIVAILGLISLFTNEHIYWIAGMILAFIDLPDFLTPMQRIASAVENMAVQETGDGIAATVPENAPAGARMAEAAPSISKGASHA